MLNWLSLLKSEFRAWYCYSEQNRKGIELLVTAVAAVEKVNPDNILLLSGFLLATEIEDEENKSLLVVAALIDQSSKSTENAGNATQ